MRIGVAASGLGHVTRGVEAWCSRLARALAERGEAVTLFRAAGEPTRPYEVLVPTWKRGEPRTDRLLSWLPRRFFWRLGLASGYDIEQTTFALGLLGHLRRRRIDVLHVKDPQVALLVQRANQLHLVPTRAILSHGTEEPVSFLRKLTFLHHLAPWHAEQARSAGVWKSTWSMIPNFIDTDSFVPARNPALRRELGIAPEAQVVLSVAAVKIKHKRVDYLLDEFSQLLALQPDPPTMLVIAGAAEADTDQLIERGRRQLGDRVRFLVNYPQARMHELYQIANLFVLCSFLEMFANVILEAAATAVPCVVHRHPVMKWVVGPGGVSIDMARPGALASQLAELLRSAARRAQLGEFGREHCVANFGRERVVSQYLEYYDRVRCHGRRRRTTHRIPAARMEPVG